MNYFDKDVDRLMLYSITLAKWVLDPSPTQEQFAHGESISNLG
jgi:hypothetical protein